jgi:PAS domain S-box-containing protein
MGPPTTSTPEIADITGGREGQPGIARLFELTSELLATISLDGRFILLNPAWEQLLGWTRDELLAAPIQHFMHPDDVEQTLALMRSGVPEGTAQTFTNRYRHRDGSWRWLLWSARRDGDTWYAAAKDVTDRRWLERQALHDPLTHLPNRLLLMDRARQAMARKRGTNHLAGRRPNNPGKRFQERALPGPVWANDGREARGRELAGQGLKRICFAIANRKIANRDPFLSAATLSAGGVGIVAAIETMDEGSLRVFSKRRERDGERLPDRCGGGAQ